MFHTWSIWDNILHPGKFEFGTWAQQDHAHFLGEWVWLPAASPWGNGKADEAWQGSIAEGAHWSPPQLVVAVPMWHQLIDIPIPSRKIGHIGAENQYFSRCFFLQKLVFTIEIDCNLWACAGGQPKSLPSLQRECLPIGAKKNVIIFGVPKVSDIRHVRKNWMVLPFFGNLKIEIQRGILYGLADDCISIIAA